LLRERVSPSHSHCGRAEPAQPEPHLETEIEMSEDDDIVKEFLIESNENLDQLDRDLIELEKEPSSKEILGRIFRAIHTVKGATGFLGFSKLESLAHSGESLLGLLRDGKLSITPEITSALLALVDAVRGMLAAIEATGQDGDDDFRSLIETLRTLGEARTSRPALSEPSGSMIEAQATNPDRPLPLGQILIQSGQVTEAEVAKALAAQNAGDPRHVGEILVEQGAIPPSAVRAAVEEQTKALALAANTIRIDVRQLDKLMNLVGEMVLARNHILQLGAIQEDTSLFTACQRLNLITTELQEGVMKTRMQPIDSVWNKLPRVVRDLAVASGKQVRVEIEGRETNLDKTVIEAIKDPLTHIIRNAVDHGIESPEKRTAVGKPPEGRLFLRACHEGGQVNIEISDDGAGVDPNRVKQKAIERGLVTPEQAAVMGDRETLNLLFLPGFSTASEVTKVSGRGVGMDVVKTNIEKIGGAIDIESWPREGTTLKIKIPLTLAIIPALIVTAAGDRYAIPQINLLELVRLEGDEVDKSIENIHGAPVYRLRGNLLPLVYLNEQLGVSLAEGGAELSGEAANIVVLQANDRRFGLVVDEVNDTEEIVVKPLGKHLKGIETFAGATIMGDGRVALILDVVGLAHRARVLLEVRERTLGEERAATASAGSEERQTLLLFRSPDDGRMAVPLSSVARLEEFPCASLERVGNEEVVQYHGSILPLVRITSLLRERRRRPRRASMRAIAAQDDKVQVVVYKDDKRSVGLIVDRILDIVEQDISAPQAASRDQVKGSIVIQGRVTEILDFEGLVRANVALRAAKPKTTLVGARDD
jgi:two-component system, chemotaxis family, sensor kinase CheA